MKTMKALWHKVGQASLGLGAALATTCAMAVNDLPGGPAELLVSARAHLSEAIRIFREAQDLSGYTLVLDALAITAGRSGERERAARLLGAVSTLERRFGTALNPWNRGILKFDADELRSDPRLRDALREGEAMSAEEAVEYGLGG